MQQKYEEAMAAYAKAMRLDPTDPGLYYRIGVVWAQQGMLDKAAEYIRQSHHNESQSDRKPMSPWVLSSRKKGRPDEAIAQFRRR